MKCIWKFVKKKTPHTFLKRIKCNVKFPFLVHSTEEVIF